MQNCHRFIFFLCKIAQNEGTIPKKIVFTMLITHIFTEFKELGFFLYGYPWNSMGEHQTKHSAGI